MQRLIGLKVDGGFDRSKIAEVEIIEIKDTHRGGTNHG